MINSKVEKKIAVCIASYKRPEGLSRLLNSLRNLEFKKCAKPEWYVIVVDNDQEGSASSVIEEIRQSFSAPIKYYVEPIKGIASARNKAVREAQVADFVAYIDDDEVDKSDWLDELLYVQSQYGADVVSGPVEYLFEHEPPKWILRGKFFSRTNDSTGKKLKYSATNNILIKNKWLYAFEGPFDMRLNLTGGEDTLFSAKIFQHGASGFWAEDAVVHEYVPQSRMTASWIIHRKWRYGLTLGTMELLMEKPIHIKVLRIMKGLLHIILSILLLLPLSLYLGYAGLITSLGRFYFGLGQIMGLFGLNYDEYK